MEACRSALSVSFQFSIEGTRPYPLPSNYSNEAEQLSLILARRAETRDCRLFVEERIWTERLVHLFNVGRRISDFFSWSEGAQRVVKKAGYKSTRAIQKGMQLTVMGSAVREGPATSPYGRRVRGKPTLSGRERSWAGQTFIRPPFNLDSSSFS